jgi:hypothetical protein
MLQKLKNAWRSKTVIFNAILAALWLFSDQLVAALPTFMPFLDESHYKTLGLVAVAGNFILRFVTHKPLEAK